MKSNTLLNATTIAKYAVCPSQVYLDLVLNDRIWEQSKALVKGNFYHMVRNYYNTNIDDSIDLLEKNRLFRKSLLDAYRYADINDFSYVLPGYTLQIEKRLNEEVSKHDEFPLISNETSLFSTKYNIKGRVDAIVNFKNSKIPWDYKTGYDPIFFDYNKVQILCYCLLLQDNGYDAPFGTIDYVDLGVQEHIKLNYNNRKLVNSIIANVINMTINKQIPKLFKCNYYKHNQYCIHCSKLSEVN